MTAEADEHLNTGTSALDRATCLDLLAAEEVGRIAFLDESGRIEVFPVNYDLDGEAVVFRTDRGTKLLASGKQVVFEVDHLEPDTHSAWSVVVRGAAGLVATTGAAHPRPWIDVPHPHVVRVPVAEVTGRRFGRAARGRLSGAGGPGASTVGGQGTPGGPCQ